jgi:hypothetical protein
MQGSTANVQPAGCTKLWHQRSQARLAIYWMCLLHTKRDGTHSLYLCTVSKFLGAGTYVHIMQVRWGAPVGRGADGVDAMA